MTQITNFTSVPETLRVSQLDRILLDGSGSMRDKWYSSLAALETYIATLQSTNTPSHIQLDIFSDQYNPDDMGSTLAIYRARDQSLRDWTSTKQSIPGAWWNGTPLYDAINHTVRELRDLDPTRCALTIITDGEEAGSRSTTHAQAKQLLDWCRAKGWQVTFIGCDFDNQAIAQLLGGTRGAIGVSQANLSSAMKALANKRHRYGLYGESMHWTDNERQTFGGYLAKPGT